MIKNGFLLVSILSVISCATEKTNVSPIANTLAGNNVVSSGQLSSNIQQSTVANSNASELTNLCSKFPLFSNEPMNLEVKNLKIYIQNYIYAVEANNTNGKTRELKKVENSYITIQKLRKNLRQLENDQLNSYLVKIKRNITALETNYSDAKNKVSEK